MRVGRRLTGLGRRACPGPDGGTLPSCFVFGCKGAAVTGAILATGLGPGPAATLAVGTQQLVFPGVDDARRSHVTALPLALQRFCRMTALMRLPVMWLLRACSAPGSARGTWERVPYGTWEHA